MEETKTQPSEQDKAKKYLPGMLIHLAALLLLLAPLFGLYWYFINQAVTKWLPLHRALMAGAGYGTGWSAAFASGSWKVMSWLGPVLFFGLVVLGFLRHWHPKYQALSADQKNNLGLLQAVVSQLLLLYYMVVSVALIMGWGELVVSLPVR